MKLLLIGGFIVIGVALTVWYYTLKTFLAVSEKTLRTTQNMAEIANETVEDEKRAARIGQRDPGLGQLPSPARDESSESKGVLK